MVKLFGISSDSPDIKLDFILENSVPIDWLTS